MAEENKAPDDPGAAFCAAAVAGDLATLQRLALGDGQSLVRGTKAVVEAAANGRLECLRWLLDQGADVNCTKTNCAPPLIWAAFNGQKEAVELLLKRGADRGLRNKNKTAADYAREKGHAEIRALLLKDPDEVSWYNTVDDRAMQEVYNFRLKERITLIRKTEGGDVEAVIRQDFPSLGDTPSLRKAFDEYRRRGGRLAEEEVFENTLLKHRHLPKPVGGA